jgi:UDP-N-acetylglucosamine--N-acetylmuramyl-(pentapeptide) pyrophosphoryl-undecaprenol N-acetylglucosamine transferase
MVTIAFTGGGTGGHIYPGLAVAAELKKQFSGQQLRLFWIGGTTGADRRLVEDSGIEFLNIPAGKLRRYFSLKTIPDFFKVITGFFAARKILKKETPLLLFSKGGFVSVPPCAAAASLGIPVFTHESDFSPGLATRINIRFVLRTGGKIFTAYSETAKFLPKAARDRIIVCGNPVRSSFRNADVMIGRSFLNVKKDERLLLVLGGSQGAQEINELIRSALPELNLYYTVVHQTGPNQHWDMPETEKYKPYPFIKEEMPHVMAAAEIIVGRSGAGIWEWAVSGKPMLLIPLRGSATRGDQIENANYFEKAGAALVLPEEDTNPQGLVQAIYSLAEDSEKRCTMAASSVKIGDLDGAKILADTLAKVVYQLPL